MDMVARLRKATYIDENTGDECLYESAGGICDEAAEHILNLRRLLAEATDLLHRCNGTFVPGNDEANAQIAAACRKFAAHANS